MKCFACKRELADGSLFCPFCGENQGFEQAVIDAARGGDQNAIADLYGRTYENVYHSIRALIRDEDTVLDLVQDTFVKAFENLDRLKDPNKFRAWVKRIGHNLAVDYTRRNHPLLFSQMSEEDSDRVLNFEDDRIENMPDAALDRRETGRLVTEILNSLSDEQRLAVGMFYYEQRSVKDIARELGVSENTVKSRLYQARGKIEIKVRALEAQGVRLYSLTPMVFLQLLLHRMEDQVPAVPADRILDSVLERLVQSGGLSKSLGHGMPRGTGVSKTAAHEIPQGAGSSKAAGAGAKRAAEESVGRSAAQSGGRSATAAVGRGAGGAAKAVTTTMAHSTAVKTAALVTAVAVTVGGGGYAVYEVTRDSEPVPAIVETQPEQESGLPEDIFFPEDGDNLFPPAAEPPAEEPQSDMLTLDRYETLYQGNMSVEYPIFRGNGAEALNYKLYERALELCTIQYTEYPQEALSGEYHCAVTLLNDRVLSLIFWGWSYIEGGVHPWTDLIPMNLDLQTLESFKLSELYRMDDPGFVELCYARGGYPGEPVTCYGPELYDEAFAHERDQSRSLRYAVDGFLKPEGVVVSGPADHFTGSDHIEVLVPWDALWEYYVGPYDPSELTQNRREQNGLDPALCEAYLRQLASREEDIRYFAAKNGASGVRNVAIRDLTGDGVPELLYITAQEGVGGAFLWIYRYENGEAVKMNQLIWEPEAGYDIRRCLFQRENDPCLYLLYAGGYADGWDTGVVRLTLQADGTFAGDMLGLETYLESGNFPDPVFEGRAYPVEEFWRLMDKFYESVSCVLLFDLRDGADGRTLSKMDDEVLLSPPCYSMHYDRAVAWLKAY